MLVLQSRVMHFCPALAALDDGGIDHLLKVSICFVLDELKDIHALAEKSLKTVSSPLERLEFNNDLLLIGQPLNLTRL